MTNGHARRKGDVYERAVVNYLNELGIPVRRAKRGNDTGDILGLPSLVIECKGGTKRFELPGWVDQMKIEQAAALAKYGVVIAKRRGKSNVAEHYFVMTVQDGMLLLQQAGVIELARNDAP